MSSTALTIYDAAAGAGKTYTLVRNYLLKILGSNSNGRYKQILAITFTNKAVSEMKERILSTLYAFALEDPVDNSMFKEVQHELSLDALSLKKRSLEVLQFILHNYTAFSVQTIDKFTQSIIRTFAFDLNLSNSFEVQLDQKLILEEAVDQLLMEVGKDKMITQIVLDYVRQQIDDDKSWDIKQLLFELGMILFRESDQQYLASLSKVSNSALLDLYKSFNKQKGKNKSEVKRLSLALLQKIETAGVIGDFSRGTLPRYFTKLSVNGTSPLRDFILKNIEEVELYAKSKTDAIKATIDNLRSEIESVFNHTKLLIYESVSIEGVVKNLPAMSLLNLLSGKIELIKKEKNQVLISEFNTLISDNIKDQPTPFIYERLGEQFKDFFVDEFQDTSEVQWKNLIPLIDNALSSYVENTDNTGTATLVGDAKQSIYRWRGGKAEQFMELSEGYTPFSNPEKKLFQLGTNYRSYSEIISFNNQFFTYLSDFLSNKGHQSLYKKGNQQKVNNKEGGYISLELFDANTKVEKDEIYPEATKKYIDEALEDGFLLKDIAVLVRKNSEAITISNYLIGNGIPVISSESLLVKNASDVRLLESVMQYVSEPNNSLSRLNTINAQSLFYNKVVSSQKVKKLLGESHELFEKELKVCFGLGFETNLSDYLSVYTLAEDVIHQFGLNKSVSSNLQFFMDVVFDYCNSVNGNLKQFLDYWDSKKESLSVITPEEQDGVRIMTIHKSKGLEFPVVILPFLDESLYAFKSSNIWVKSFENNIGIDHLYWRFNRKVFDYYGDSLVENANEVLAMEELDIINVLYVAFTRAVNRLYLLGNEKQTTLSLDKGNVISFIYDFFSVYNGNSSSHHRLTIGDRVRIAEKNKVLSENESIHDFVFQKMNNDKLTLSSVKSEAIRKGDVVHLAMSKIYDRSDVDKAFKEIENATFLKKEEKQKLKKQINELLEHEFFESFFRKSNTIYNERDFYLKEELLRPDRIEISNGKDVIIIDYKTGAVDEKHREQLEKYQEIVKTIGYENVKKYLIYFDQALKIMDVP